MIDFHPLPHLARLASLDEATLRPATARFPAVRQPVHTLYGGAHLYKAETPKKLGSIAERFVAKYIPNAEVASHVFDVPIDLAARVLPRVVEKLAREPVEDLRIDFEDGYGSRGDEEEDAHASAAGAELARAMDLDLVPEVIGARIKSLDRETRARSLRTLHRFLGALATSSGSKLPKRFVVTLPKVQHRDEVEVLAGVLDEMEECLGFESGTIGIEIMVETPRSLVGPNGEIALEQMIAAARGRATGAHFGTYDFTASLGVVAAYQSPDHPACDLALGLMQLACAPSGVFVSDGATTELPIPPHRSASPTADEELENQRTVDRALRLHYRNVRRALARGVYQGWDLHPGQLPARYAAVHAFFLEGLEDASTRLAAFVANLARATSSGTSFDDAATGQGLLNYFLRAVAAGAIEEAEVARRTGLSPAEIAGRSFAAIAAARRR